MVCRARVIAMITLDSDDDRVLLLSQFRTRCAVSCGAARRYANVPDEEVDRRRGAGRTPRSRPGRRVVVEAGRLLHLSPVSLGRRIQVFLARDLRPVAHADLFTRTDEEAGMVPVWVPIDRRWRGAAGRCRPTAVTSVLARRSARPEVVDLEPSPSDQFDRAALPARGAARPVPTDATGGVRSCDRGSAARRAPDSGSCASGRTRGDEDRGPPSACPRSGSAARGHASGVGPPSGCCRRGGTGCLRDRRDRVPLHERLQRAAALQSDERVATNVSRKITMNVALLNTSTLGSALKPRHDAGRGSLKTGTAGTERFGRGSCRSPSRQQPGERHDDEHEDVVRDVRTVRP